MLPTLYLPVSLIAAACVMEANSTFPKLAFTLLKNSNWDAEHLFRHARIVMLVKRRRGRTTLPCYDDCFRVVHSEAWLNPLTKVTKC